MLKQVGVPVDELLSQRPDSREEKKPHSCVNVSESSDEASLANLDGNCTPARGEGETGRVWDDVSDLDIV
jgi:hypothetical protein